MAGIITFTGPSGAGKTTIITRLFQNLPALRFVPSYTTREARPSDFPSEFRHVAPEEFEELEHKGEFLWSVEAHKNRYGTRKDDVDKALLLDQYSAMTLLPDAVRK
ncbi:MAG: guanylate kinase, partial [Candidatus Pacearchaeota archaeon]|nr:guanylate kinase [Candidatus Pacearchaeota archaeon]